MKKVKFSDYLLSEKFKILDYSKKSDEDGKKVDGNVTEEDPDKQGLIRTIKNAKLMYKRKDSDGTFTELWMYGIGKGLKDEFETRKSILDGTDINVKSGYSQDGQQRSVVWTAGNRQFLEITGLPN